MNVYSYDSKLAVPEGATLRNAADILEIKGVFADGQIKKPYAIFADLFRYKLLQKLDTTWVDCDVILVGDSLPPDDFLFGKQSATVVNNAVLRAPRDSALVEELVSRSFSSKIEKWSWGDTGPQLLTALVYELGYRSLALGTKVLYPIPYEDAWMLFDPKSTSKVKRRIKNASTLHVWNEVIAIGNPNFRFELPPEGSYLAELIQNLEVKISDLPTMDSGLITEAVRKANSPAKLPKKFLRWLMFRFSFDRQLRR